RYCRIKYLRLVIIISQFTAYLFCWFSYNISRSISHNTFSYQHQQYVFDTIWNISTSAERKIKEIESEGSLSFGIAEIIDNPLKTLELFINLIKSAKYEVLL